MVWLEFEYEFQASNSMEKSANFGDAVSFQEMDEIVIPIRESRRI